MTPSPCRRHASDPLPLLTAQCRLPPQGHDSSTVSSPPCFSHFRLSPYSSTTTMLVLYSTTVVYSIVDDEGVL